MQVVQRRNLLITSRPPAFGMVQIQQHDIGTGRARDIAPSCVWMRVPVSGKKPTQSPCCSQLTVSGVTPQSSRSARSSRTRRPDGSAMSTATGSASRTAFSVASLSLSACSAFTFSVTSPEATTPLSMFPVSSRTGAAESSRMDLCLSPKRSISTRSWFQLHP